jgi:hypothetical protein
MSFLYSLLLGTYAVSSMDEVQLGMNKVFELLLVLEGRLFEKEENLSGSKQ